MMKKAIALVLTLCCIGSGACANLRSSRSAGPQSDWDAVMRLPISSHVRVNSHQALTQGQLVAVDTAGVDIRYPDGIVRIVRGDIRRITLLERQTRQKAQRGFGVGAGLALLIGFINGSGADFKLMLASGWGALGAMFGAIDGVTDIREVIVYDAPIRQPWARRRVPPGIP